MFIYILWITIKRYEMSICNMVKLILKCNYFEKSFFPFFTVRCIEALSELLLRRTGIYMYYLKITYLIAKST